VSAGVPATLVVRAPNWLGDTVMAQPALAGLREAMPEATITVIGRWAGLLRGQGIADALLGYPAPPARRRFARALADAHPDLAVVLPNSFEAARAAYHWGARRRLGFDTDARGLYLTDRVPLPEPRRHQVDEYRLLIEALGVTASAHEPRLRVPDDAAAEAEVDALLDGNVPRGRGPIGLHLGAAAGPAKRWTPAAWAVFADHLHALALPAVLLGGPDDAAAAEAVLELAATPLRSLVGRDRPALLPHLLPRLRALVSADTGVAHLAAALGVVTVTLFGPTDPRLTAARSARARVVAPGAPCAPCFLDACPIDHVCMRAIDAEAVATVVREAVG
jgi:lipopolysaccharide heptosyltransferase II